MMNNEMLQSRTIAFLRFPLIVGVVLIHSKMSDVVIGGVKMANVTDYPVFEKFMHLFSEIFPAIAVPLFFFISGFLFFYKVETFGKQTYIQKLKKRTRTILVPYLCWNLLIIFLRLFADNFFPGLLSGRNKLTSDYIWSDWLWTFWNTQMINPDTAGTYPINYPFWFIRDLMIVMLFSPMIYLFVKKLKTYAVLILGICWLSGFWIDWVGFSITAFFFFATGAYFSIHQKNFVNLLKSKLMSLTLVYVAFIVVELCFRGAIWIEYVHEVGILFGMALAIGMTAYFLGKGCCDVNSFLSESSFFVYAYHAMPLAFIIKLAFRMIQPHSGITLWLLYVLCPAITILIGLGIYYILKRYVPRFTAVITGGR